MFKATSFCVSFLGIHNKSRQPLSLLRRACCFWYTRHAKLLLRFSKKKIFKDDLCRRFTISGYHRQYTNIDYATTTTGYELFNSHDEKFITVCWQLFTLWRLSSTKGRCACFIKYLLDAFPWMFCFDDLSYTAAFIFRNYVCMITLVCWQLFTLWRLSSTKGSYGLFIKYLLDALPPNRTFFWKPKHSVT